MRIPDACPGPILLCYALTPTPRVGVLGLRSGFSFQVTPRVMRATGPTLTGTGISNLPQNNYRIFGLWTVSDACPSQSPAPPASAGVQLPTLAACHGSGKHKDSTLASVAPFATAEPLAINCLPLAVNGQVLVR